MGEKLTTGGVCTRSVTFDDVPGILSGELDLLVAVAAIDGRRPGKPPPSPHGLNLGVGNNGHSRHATSH
ncbi:MAG: hypothetical protein K9J76_09495 [Polaromonas sp.]|nr:hypothetical protein [Polaromonas sp.]